CVYAGVAQTLRVEADVPPVNDWDAIRTTGYQYKDKTAGTGGISQILLKGGSAGKILMKGKNGSLDLTPTTLPFTGGVLVQLSNSDNFNCWETYFSTSTKNGAAEFKAKADTTSLNCTGGGVNVGGVCWYLGGPAASCDSTCSGVGRVCDAATLSYAGTGGTSAD